MASLHPSSGGIYRLSFRYGGRQFLRSLETCDLATAREAKAVVERTLRHLREGVLLLPERLTGDQLWQFLRCGGTPTSVPKIVPSVSLRLVGDRYLESFAAGAKDVSTLATERIHTRHFCRILGNGIHIEQITAADIRRYVVQRRQETGRHGGVVQPVTIGKELQTLRQLWEFARTEGHVSGENPVSKVSKPRGDQKPPFMAWEEVERRIQRGGLTEVEQAELWECLFLRESETCEFLEHVRLAIGHLPRFFYIYPAIAFCAYTGARRSEMFRCRVDDAHGQILLREKKRSKEQGITFRELPLHPELGPILGEWLQNHPGGQFMFCKRNGAALDDKTARQAFAAVTKNSRWNVLRGYHILRHSFASNLARHGVDQYKIDELMGHQTEEMRRRYRHLFPEDRKSAVSVLSFRPRVVTQTERKG